jgi:alpha-2-macroglobulin
LEAATQTFQFALIIRSQIRKNLLILPFTAQAGRYLSARDFLRPSPCMRRLFPSLLAALVLLACSRAGQPLERPETNFTQLIDPEQNLTFTFAEDVVADSVVGRWDTTQVVTLSPRLPGQVRWTSRRELTFSPRQPFAPATSYRATLQPTLLPKPATSAAARKLPSDATFAFHTPFLALTGARGYWAGKPGVAGAAEARLQLRFNYPVRPADVVAKLRVLANNKAVEAKLVAAAAGLTDEVTVALPSLGIYESESNPVPVSIRVAAGLPVPGAVGQTDTEQALEIGTEVPPRDALNVTEMTASFAQGQGRLNVFLTQPVVTDDVPALLTLSPAVPFTVRPLDNGFQLVGDFAAGKSYDVTLSGNLRGTFGTTLGQEVRQTVSFGTEPPRVAFADETRLYLGAAGARNLALNLAGVRRVRVTVTKVYETNIQRFLSAEEDYGWDDEATSNYSGEGGEQEYEDHSYRYYDTDAVGDVLLSRTVDVKAMPRQGNARLLHLSLQELEFGSAMKGMYVIRVRDTERRWLQASQLVVVSDIGLVARQSRGGLLVIASSVKTAEPLAGVEIAAYSKNNQVVARGKTAADGTVLIQADQIGAGIGGFNQDQSFSATGSSESEENYYNSSNRADEAANAAPDNQPTTGRFELGLLTARKDKDFSVLDLQKSLVDVARFDVGGYTSNVARYMAFCYGDRDLYRPGDTIRAHTLVRTPDDWQPVTGVPLNIRLVLPTGRSYQTQRLTLDKQGAAPASFIIPPTVMTGRWTIEVLTANDVLLASRKLSVEEFLPDRMRVKVEPVRTSLMPGEVQTINVTATTLFGPPAAHRHYEVEFSLRSKTFQPKGYDDFNFTLNSSPNGTLESVERVVKEGETDDQGRSEALTYTVPAHLQGMGLLTGTAFAAVFDETGRPVNRLTEFEVRTQPGMVGIGRFEAWRGTNQPLAVPLVILDSKGQPLSSQPLTVRVVRRVWETIVERQYGRFSYNSQPRDQVVLQQQLMSNASGRATLDYNALASGEYEIQAWPTGTAGNGGRVSASFYAYGSANTTANAFAVNNEGRVDISADKERYQVGDKAKILLKAPFKGRLLVTVERDRVLQRYSVTTTSRSASIEIPLTADCRPNVFVTVTAIRPHGAGGADASPLTVARGYQPLLVDAPAAKLPVEISVAEKSRSHRALPINIKTAPNARVTVAVVDEGILQMKDFQTPDPYAFFYQRRALEVLGYDLYPLLFPERLPGPLGSHVGGDAYNLARRVNPLTSKRVRLVSLWSGVLVADGAGNAHYTARIPQFSGAVRVMAVAYRNDAFGSAEKEVKVADPVVISAALPRFLSPTDTVTVPVTLTNTTNRAAPATATLTVGGPLRIVGSATATASLPANSEGQVRFRVAAPAGIGNGSVEVAVKALNETFHDRTELPIRPAAALTSFAESGTVAGGASQALNFGAGSFLPGTLRARLTVGRSPLARFADDLRYLIQYPYGCLEQTVSAAFPQLYYGDLARALGQGVGQPGSQPTRFNPTWHVQEAIRKLESMQQPDGSLSYWPGGTETNWWGSAYAAHFLTEAQRAGQPVSRAVLDRLLAYLNAQVRPRPTARETVYDAQGRPTSRIIAKREALYSLYVLALNQQADATALNYYKANLPLLGAESRYLLAAALYASGNGPAARAVVPAVFSPANEAAQRNMSGDFASPVRDEAIGLLALLDVSPDHPTVPALARRLSQQLSSQRWLSTQERAFALLALGRQARRDAGSTVTATLVSGVKQLAAFNGQPLTLTAGLTGTPVQVKTSGKGTLYFTKELEGIPLDGRSVPLTDENLMVRRQLLDRTGAPWPADHVFRQGELVVVRLTLQSAATIAEVPNVALADLLPAGLEIENPRLGAQRELDWAKSSFEPDYLDVRDDRLTLFTTATPEPKIYYYLARAVSRGSYVQAPVTAAAMYDATYRSASGGGVVRVQ